MTPISFRKDCFWEIPSIYHCQNWRKNSMMLEYYGGLLLLRGIKTGAVERTKYDSLKYLGNNMRIVLKIE